MKRQKKIKVGKGAALSRVLPLWPHFHRDEINAVAAVLRSGKVNYWTGEKGRQFEKEFAAFLGVKYAVALMNGSVALEAALIALNVGSGDEVIVTPRSFIASVSCVVLRGARPVFVDVDRNSQNITADTIEKAITRRTRAIIAVHLAGWPCEMDAIMALARKHKVAVIEDCAQAMGALYKGKPVGSFGDVAVFSFCQDKIMTTGGEGGMVVTNNKHIWTKIWSYKDHGKSYNAVHFKKHPPGFRWVHESFGTNWRMTEIQAAIGLIQLRKLKGWIEKRRRNAKILTNAFLKIQGLRVTIPPENIFHSYYKYYVFVRPEFLKKSWDRDRVLVALNDKGVPCFAGSCGEIYREKAFQKTGFRPVHRLPVARELGKTALMFNVHPTLSAGNVIFMAKAVFEVMEEASK